MTLEVTRHGYDFAKDDKLNKLSDLENHRLGLHFISKNGKKTVGFVYVCRNHWKEIYPKVGIWQKCPDNYLTYKFHYYVYNGSSYVLCMPYSEPREFAVPIIPKGYYIATKEGLLDLVNSLSKDTYTDVKIHSEEDSYKIFNKWCKWGKRGAKNESSSNI